MPKGGQNAVAASVKQLENNPGRRPIVGSAIVPPPGCPSPPAWLNDVAREYWMSNAPMLYAAGVLTLMDAERFALLAHTFSRMRGADSEYNERDWAKFYNSVMDHFAMSALMRTRIKMPDGGKNDKKSLVRDRGKPARNRPNLVLLPPELAGREAKHVDTDAE